MINDSGDASESSARGAANSVSLLLQASPVIQEDLVRLGFLADCDRGDSDAVADAVAHFLSEGKGLFTNLNTLFVSLREARRRLDAVSNSHANAAQLRDSALCGLDSVLQFLMLFPQVRGEGLLTPLARLFGDLKSLDDGAVRPMVTPARKPGQARASGFYDELKGIAFFVVRRLEASGLSRRSALETVAKELNKLGVRPARRGSIKGGRFTWQTLAKWIRDIRADVELKTAAARGFLQIEQSNERRIFEGEGVTSSLPAASTADALELARTTSSNFRRGYLDRLGRYVRETGLSLKT